MLTILGAREHSAILIALNTKELRRTEFTRNWPFQAGLWHCLLVQKFGLCCCRVVRVPLAISDSRQCLKLVSNTINEGMRTVSLTCGEVKAWDAVKHLINYRIVP